MQGINSRLDALQAAILRVKLRYLDAWAKGRTSRADRYRRLFDEKLLTRLVNYPAAPPSSFTHVYNQFTIRAQRRDELREFLTQAGIPSEIYYPLCLHLQKAFSFLGYRAGQMPVAEKASKEVLSVPVFPELTDEQQDTVVCGIENFYLRRK